MQEINQNYVLMYIENFMDAFDMKRSKYKYNEKYDFYTFLPKETYSVLQEKINAYIVFCEEHQYNQIYPNMLIEYAILEIHFKYEPTTKAMNFLEQVQRQVNELGIMIECHITEEYNQ